MFRKKIRWKSKAPVSYSYDEDQMYHNYENEDGAFYNETFYDTASRLKDWNTFELDNLTPSDKLAQISNEIKIRTKITKQEIFRIGELLYIAKPVCREGGQDYRDWIKDNFDFSYETAHNFVNVYLQCFCYRNLALKIPSSILYKISQPGFSGELRKFLFEEGNLEEMTNGNLKSLVEKYKKGGIVAVKENIKKIGEGILINRQTEFTFDICENALRVLTDLSHKIESRGKSGISLDMTSQINSLNQIAGKINMDLFLTVEGMITELDNAVRKSRKKLNHYYVKVEQANM